MPRTRLFGQGLPCAEAAAAAAPYPGVPLLSSRWNIDVRGSGSFRNSLLHQERCWA